MIDRRIEAAEAFVKALRTGETAATAWLAGFLHADVALTVNGAAVQGRQEVLARVSGQWPLTPVYLHGAWSAPVLDADQVKVSATFPSLGAAPQAVHIAFSFDGSGALTRVEQTNVMAARPQPLDTIPALVRGAINSALANGTPITLAYVDALGRPVQSLRGSVQVFSDHELCLWVRNAAGGLVAAMAANSALSLLYRDSRSRTTLIIQGHGRIEMDNVVRERVYHLIPEVEQTHDPARQGAALLITVERIQGTSPHGPVLIEC